MLYSKKFSLHSNIIQIDILVFELYTLYVPKFLNYNEKV
jgi:hypothetical protein